jgi:uncharacterized HAD superfamily protein
MDKKNTFFCDIDGTIFKYRKFETYKTSDAQLIPGVKEQLDIWNNQGHMIILTTARPEDLRAHTEKELEKNHIPYKKLLMGIERGPRFLINDMDPGKPGKRATGINLERNKGFEEKILTDAGL